MRSDARLLSRYLEQAFTTMLRQQEHAFGNSQSIATPARSLTELAR